MNDQDSSKCLEIDEERSIIVVSDLHLGGQKGEKTSKDFLSFLDWLTQLCDKNNTIEVEQSRSPTPRRLNQVQLLILLGDIVDLWVQRESLRRALFKDSLPIFSKLHDLPIPIVYVIGNHDQEVYEINGIFPIETKSDKKIIIQPDQFSNRKIRIQPINPQGLKLGKYEYVFLHGHQLDKKFKFAGFLSEFPGWIANNSSIFKAHPYFKGAIWIVFILGFLYSILLWREIVPYSTPLLILFGMSIPIFVISIPSQYLKSFYEKTSQNPIGKRITNWIKKRIHDERGKGIRELIEERKFKQMLSEDTETNVVVFGHTHMPDCYQYKKYILINTGSWDSDEPSDINLASHPKYEIVGIDTKSPQHKPRNFVWNSFVYIDKSGYYHLVWDTESSSVPKARFLDISHDGQKICPEWT